MPHPANDPGPSRLDVTADDLRRYAASSLSPERRRTVEGFLACNPDLAAEMMGALHRRPPPPRPRPFGRVVVGSVLALGIGAGSALAGWIAAERRDLEGWREVDGDTPPAYVEEAAESRQASGLRAAMASQPETVRLDIAEIRRAVRVEVPRLPASWRVLDVQVYPTDGGPGVNLTVQTPSGDHLTLFMVRADTTATDRPELARRGRDVVAFWERGQSAYVLSSDGSSESLMSSASALSAGRTL